MTFGIDEAEDNVLSKEIPAFGAIQSLGGRKTYVTVLWPGNDPFDIPELPGKLDFVNYTSPRI